MAIEGFGEGKCGSEGEVMRRERKWTGEGEGGGGGVGFEVGLGEVVG